jgi:hypothetical protein
VSPSSIRELMIRMLVVGYVFAIRSERLICREVQVNLAYSWFCKLGIEELSRIIRHFRAPATERFRSDDDPPPRIAFSLVTLSHTVVVLSRGGAEFGRCNARRPAPKRPDAAR